MTIGTVTTANGTVTTGCDSATVTKNGGTCSFTADWTSAPVGASTTSITVPETGGYFNDVTITTALDNSCD